MFDYRAFSTVNDAVARVLIQGQTMIIQSDVIRILGCIFQSEQDSLYLLKDEDFTTLQEQICALFFTNTVMEIDVAFFTDFLVVLMSNQVEKQLKVTLLLKTIQDCLECAKTGKSDLVRLASQRLFELTLKTKMDQQTLMEANNPPSAKN